MNLENNVKEWVKYDTMIKQYQDHIAQLKQKRDNCENNIYQHIKDKSKYPIINISNGVLKMGVQTTYQPLSFKYIESCLEKKFDKREVDDLVNDLKQKRESRNSFYIKRTYK